MVLVVMMMISDEGIFRGGMWKREVSLCWDVDGRIFSALSTNCHLQLALFDHSPPHHTIPLTLHLTIPLSPNHNNARHHRHPQRRLQPSCWMTCSARLRPLPASTGCPSPNNKCVASGSGLSGWMNGGV